MRDKDISYLADCANTPDLFDACYFNNTNAINNSVVIADRDVQPWCFVFTSGGASVAPKESYIFSPGSTAGLIMPQDNRYL